MLPYHVKLAYLTLSPNVVRLNVVIKIKVTVEIDLKPS